LLPDWMETFVLFVVPAVLVCIFIALPFISPDGEKSYRKRPVAVLTVILVMLIISVLCYLGDVAPWSPKMNAWTGDPIPVAFVKGRTPVELRGAAVLQAKQCRNCHSLGGLGGERGPALDDVASRLTKDQLVRQVIQGGGNMPAYGKNLNPAEVESLVAFMATLHTGTNPPARDSAVPAVPPAVATMR